MSRLEAFWLDALFWQARSAPLLGRTLKPLAVRAAYRCSRAVRDATHANARRIFGPDVTSSQVKQYAEGLLSNFFDFVCEVGRCIDLSDDQLRNQIASVEGLDAYIAARDSGRGAIIATAHMGSFEAAAAALREREQSVHVVFKRDPSRFEQVRSALRQRLGIIESPVDDGWGMWLKLRDALQRNEVVMLQADRVMPGQKGISLPFLHGHLAFPPGPIKLAVASGAPIIPIFALRAPDGRVDVRIEPAIEVAPSDESLHPAHLQLAAILEKYVQSNPQQWLMLHRAFCEDVVA